MASAPDSRATRRSKDEIHDLMLSAGLELLAEQGLGIGAGGLTFKRVFERVESSSGVRLTNASVIRRVWENQADFQDEVLGAVARMGDSGGESGYASEALLPWFASLDCSTPEGRMRGLSEAARVGGAASLEALATSRTWSLWVGVWVLAVTSPWSERGVRIRQALLEGYESTTELWVELHGAVVDAVGLRLREPLTLRQFTVSVGALVEGCALRHGADKDVGTILRPTGPRGELQEWTLFGVGLEALALQYFEIDPDWTVPGAST